MDEEKVLIIAKVKGISVEDEIHPESEVGPSIVCIEYSLTDTQFYICGEAAATAAERTKYESP